MARGPPGRANSSCDRGKPATVADGKLTVGTDKPAYAPWFHDDDPANGKGFESAVAYAVARQLGYDKGAVRWQTVPFNNAFAPGEKKFDFDINQISISADRKRAVDFSSGYYDVRQAVIALKGSRAARAKSIADLAARQARRAGRHHQPGRRSTTPSGRRSSPPSSRRTTSPSPR